MTVICPACGSTETTVNNIWFICRRCSFNDSLEHLFGSSYQPPTSPMSPYPGDLAFRPAFPFAVAPAVSPWSDPTSPTLFPNIDPGVPMGSPDLSTDHVPTGLPGYYDSPLQSTLTLIDPNSPYIPTVTPPGCLSSTGSPPSFTEGSSSTSPASIPGGVKRRVLKGKVASDPAVEAASVRRRKPADYVCLICGRDFTKRHNLDSHLRSHFGDKPFDCRFCGLMFARKSDCARHEQNICKQRSSSSGR